MIQRLEMNTNSGKYTEKKSILILFPANLEIILSTMRFGSKKPISETVRAGVVVESIYAERRSIYII